MKLEEIQAKLDAFKRRKNGGEDSRLVKLNKGAQKIRIVPHVDGDSFQEVFIHYKIGDRPFLCPKKNFGEECAACEFAAELYAIGDEDSLDLSKTLYAKARYYSPVLVRGEEDKGVRWWSYSPTIYESLLNKFLNPDYGDFTDPEKGFDWTLTFTPKEDTKNGFPKTELDPDRKSSPLVKGGSSALKKLLSTTPNINEINLKKTSQEVQDLLDRKLAKSPESVATEQEKYGDDDKSDLDKAFEDLNKEE